jgi:ABC-type cobalamin/Fe3+-siderophores transport system ATPase subunit
MNVLYEIIEWAKDLHKWQQLAIKTILDGSAFDTAKIDEIISAALDDSKIKDGLLDQLIYSEKNNSKVCLVNIAELNNINNLKDGESLSFNTAGLTVVYGQNGAGKSGYTRIIKKCCRSRDKNTAILGNVHTPSKKEQSAKINYLLDDIEKVHVWSNEANVLPELQSVHVFDRPSGDVFLSKEADIQYKPSGMDILDKLVEVLQKIEKELQERSDNLQISDLTSFFQDQFGETKATALVANLDAPNALEEYDSLSQLNETEQAEMNALLVSIVKREASSPAKEHEKLIKLTDTLQNVKSYYSGLLSLLAEEKIKSLNSKIINLGAAKKNADDAKELTFDSAKFLTGTGNEAWRIMWRAAEAFSKEFAYKGEDYPVIKAAAKCVLCQQTLDSEHSDNMAQFGKYINDESQKILMQCQSKIAAEISTIKGLIKKPEDEDTLLRSIEEIHPEIYEELKKLLPSLRDDISGVFTALEKATEIQVNGKAMELRKKLESSIIDILAANEAELKKPLDDAEFKTQLEKDKAKLNGYKTRLALKNHEVAILNNIKLIPKHKQLDAIKKQCGTYKISNKITELSKKYIIGSLSKFYNDELQEITNGKIEAKLIPAGTKQGVPYSKIVLQLKDGESHYDKIGDVLSEGELRGAALAGFFAELTMTNNSSAIVLDDPVSSLDHINAGRIADRIVKEAQTRQVIVFTHDILFVSYIMDCLKSGKQPSFKTVDCLDEAGIVTDGLPFDKLSVKKRVCKLKNTLEGQIRPAYKKGQITEYRQLAEHFYKDLRMTWERAVEEILFGDVVKRFSRNVSTQQLKDVKYTLENSKIVEENMTTCSNKLLHDPARSEEVDFGTPDNLAKDLKALEDFGKDNPKNE